MAVGSPAVGPGMTVGSPGFSFSKPSIRHRRYPGAAPQCWRQRPQAIPSRARLSRKRRKNTHVRMWRPRCPEFSCEDTPGGASLLTSAGSLRPSPRRHGGCARCCLGCGTLLRVEKNLSDGGTGTDGIQVLISYALWAEWGEIAAERKCTARAARAESVAQHRHGQEPAPAMLTELLASMAPSEAPRVPSTPSTDSSSRPRSKWLAQGTTRPARRTSGSA
jgi:hypothetical protein